MREETGGADARVFAIERPDPALFRYYVLASFAAGPFFPVLLLYLYFRYHTLRYRFDEEGISMRWGALFRREINLTYARIQDIHLSSNVVERWLGLARIEIQTASGSAKAEMTIEGVPAFEELRDFLYARMRGARDGGEVEGRSPRIGAPAPGVAPAGDGSAGTGDLAHVLREVAGEIRSLREELAAERPRQGAPGE